MILYSLFFVKKYAFRLPFGLLVSTIGNCFIPLRCFDIIIFFFSEIMIFSVSKKYIFFSSLFNLALFPYKQLLYTLILLKSIQRAIFFYLMYNFLTAFWCMHLLYTLIQLRNMQTDANTYSQIRIFFSERKL